MKTFYQPLYKKYRNNSKNITSNLGIKHPAYSLLQL